MEFVEKTGKTVEEAINAALKDLNTTKENVDIEILEKETKGFLGILGSKPAKVKVTKKYNPVSVAVIFLKEIFLAMGITVDIETEFRDNKYLLINLLGQEMGILIGKRGQTLDSLQYLVNLVVNKGDTGYISITLDTENYRQRRKDTLEALAKNLAKKVKSTRKSVVLEPMNPYERRIIHSILQNDKFITTHSEGEDPYRYIIISLKNNN